MPRYSIVMGNYRVIILNKVDVLIFDRLVQETHFSKVELFNF